MRNVSEQYEARVALVRVERSPSVVLAGMHGSTIPIVVAHGEGQAEFGDAAALAGLEARGGVALRYVDTRGRQTQRFPANPNGSSGAVAAVCSEDGRVTITMPHPRSGSSGPCKIRGHRPSGAKMARGCGCFATPVSGSGESIGGGRDSNPRYGFP